MGAWSYHILESDDAMDAESDILEAAGCTVAGEPVENCDIRSALEKHLPALQGELAARVATWRQAFDTYHAKDRTLPLDVSEGNRLARQRYTLAVEGQVLAALLMHEGCAVPETVRDWLIAVASNCYEYRLGSSSPEDVRTRLAAVGALPELDETLKIRGSARVQGRTAAIQDLLDKLTTYDLRGGTSVTLAASFEKAAP